MTHSVSAFTEQNSNDNPWGSPFPATGLWIPPKWKVTADSSELRCRHANQGVGARLVYPPDSLLSEFIELGNAAPSQIARFARKWGLLGLCKAHELPADHVINWDRYGVLRIGCRRHTRVREDTVVTIESLDAWRRFSSEAKALLDIGVALRHNDETTKADWEIALTSSERWKRLRPLLKSPAETEYEASDLRQILARHVEVWVRLGGVRPVLSWGELTIRTPPAKREPPPYPTILYNYSGLFGALAVRLMLAIAQGKGITICSICGEGFTPARRPRSDRRVVCSAAACKRVLGRDASQRYRRKKK